MGFTCFVLLPQIHRKGKNMLCIHCNETIESWVSLCVSFYRVLQNISVRKPIRLWWKHAMRSNHVYLTLLFHVNSIREITIWWWDGKGVRLEVVQTNKWLSIVICRIHTFRKEGSLKVENMNWNRIDLITINTKITV